MKRERRELGIPLPHTLLKYVHLCQRYGYENELGSIWLPYDCFPLSRRNCSNHQWKLSDTEGAVVKYRRGRGNIPNSSPPLILQILQINIWVSQAERRFHLGTAKIVTRGYEGVGEWGQVLQSQSLSLLSTYAIIEEEMPTGAASVNEKTAVGITELTFSKITWQPISVTTR